VVAVDCSVALALALFAVEELDYRHAGDVFLKEGVEPGQMGSYILKCYADAVLEEDGCVEHEGKDGEDDESELPVDEEHEDDND